METPTTMAMPMPIPMSIPMPNPTGPTDSNSNSNPMSTHMPMPVPRPTGSNPFPAPLSSSNSSSSYSVLPSYHENGMDSDLEDEQRRRAFSGVGGAAGTGGDGASGPDGEEANHSCRWGSCLYIALNADDLYDHLTASHVGRKSTNNLCLTCHWESCGVVCAKRDHITSHLRVHTNLKPHGCSICRKQFKRPQDLKKHEKIHTEEHHVIHRHSKATMINSEGEAVAPPRYNGSSKGYGKSKVPLTGKTTMKVATKTKARSGSGAGAGGMGGPPSASMGRRGSASMGIGATGRESDSNSNSMSMSSRRSNQGDYSETGSESEGGQFSGGGVNRMGKKRNSDGDIVTINRNGHNGNDNGLGNGRGRKSSTSSRNSSSAGSSLSPRAYPPQPGYPTYPSFANAHPNQSHQMQNQQHHHQQQQHQQHQQQLPNYMGNTSGLYPGFNNGHTQFSHHQQQQHSLHPQHDGIFSSVPVDLSLSVSASIAERHRLEYERLLEQQKQEIIRLARMSSSGPPPAGEPTDGNANGHGHGGHGHGHGHDLHRSLSMQQQQSHHHSSSSPSLPAMQRYGSSLPDRSGSGSEFGPGFVDPSRAMDQLYSDVKKRKVEPVYDAGMAARLEELAHSLSAFPSGSQHANANGNGYNNNSQHHGGAGAGPGGLSSSFSSDHHSQRSPSFPAGSHQNQQQTHHLDFVAAGPQMPEIKSPEDLAAFNKFMLSLGESAESQQQHGQSQGSGGGHVGTSSHGNLFDAATLAQLGLTGMPGMPSGVSGASGSGSGSGLGNKYDSSTLDTARMYPTAAYAGDSPTEITRRQRSSSNGSHASLSSSHHSHSVETTARPMAGLPSYNGFKHEQPLNHSSVYPSLPNNSNFSTPPINNNNSNANGYNFDQAVQQLNSDTFASSFDSLAKSRAHQPTARLDPMDFSQSTYRSHNLLGSSRSSAYRAPRSPPTAKSSLDVLTEVCEEEVRRRDRDGDGDSDKMSEDGQIDQDEQDVQLVDEPEEMDVDEDEDEDEDDTNTVSNVSPPLPRGLMTEFEAGSEYKLPALRRKIHSESPSVYPSLSISPVKVEEEEERSPVGILPGVACLLSNKGPSSLSRDTERLYVRSPSPNPSAAAKSRHVQLIRDIIVKVNQKWKQEHS